MKPETANWVIPIGATVVVWIWIFIMLATQG